MTNQLNVNVKDFAENLRGVTPRAKLLAVYIAGLYATEAPDRHLTINLSSAEEWLNLSPVELRCAFDELPNVVWRKSRFGRDQIDLIHVPGEDGFGRDPI